MQIIFSSKMAIPKSLDTHDCLIEMGNFEALSPYVIFSASMYRTYILCIEHAISRYTTKKQNRKGKGLMCSLQKNEK